MNKGDRVIVTNKTLLASQAQEVLKNVEQPKATIIDIDRMGFIEIYMVKLDDYEHEQVLPPQAVRKLDGENDE